MASGPGLIALLNALEKIANSAYRAGKGDLNIVAIWPGIGHDSTTLVRK